MKIIVPPLKPGDTGAPAANLIEVMVLLVERGVIKPLDSSNPPTADELKQLANSARDELVQSQFGKATRQLVIYFQIQQDLGKNLRGVVEDTTAAKLNEWLKTQGLVDIPEPDGFVVRGTVTNSEGKPLVGGIVRAFDRDLRKAQLLGRAETDDQGQYIIRYASKDFASGDLPSAIAPSLIVRSFTDGQQIGKDVTRPKPTRDEVVDFTVSAPVVSEWETMCAGIIPLLEGQGKDDQTLPPWELNAGDFDFIAEETGLDRDHIRLWALAFAVARDAGMLTEPRVIDNIGAHARPNPVAVAGLSNFAIFYGWFRMGLPTDVAAWWSRATEDLIATLKEAIEANLVPRDLSLRFDELKATINQLRAARALQPAPEGQRSSLGDLLNTLPPNEALSESEKLNFARLRDEHADTNNLWKQAEASGLSRAIPALKRTLALDAITAGHPLLMQALQTKSDVKRPDSVEFLTALESTDWIELVFEHGVPPGSGLDRDRYIEQLQVEVEGKFPTQVLSKQLKKKLNENEVFPTGRVLSFLNANPDFDFKNQHVEPFLRQTGNTDDKLLGALLQVQRIHALTANAGETGQLLDAGYGSAAQIISEGKSNVAQRMANKLSPEQIERVFSVAENVVSTTVALGTAFNPSSTSGNAVNVIPANSISSEALNNYPSLRTLFGDVDYCECRHCRSVLGPAAYLADLMHFLQRSPLTTNPGALLSPANLNNVDPHLELEAVMTGTVLGALLKRRPDLADLELSCENTNTEIPYIDLVLEILENAVALPLDVDSSEYAGIDIEAELGKAESGGGKVPKAIVDALRKTDIEVGKNLTVTNYRRNAAPSSVDVSSWIIKDGSRRWSVQYMRSQLVFATASAAHPQYLQGPKVLDADGAVNALKQGKLNAELEEKLSKELPISGVPQIQRIPGSNNSIQLWTALYTRAIAIKITMGAPIGVVNLFKLDGTGIRSYQWPLGILQNFSNAFTIGATSKINPNVAQLLEIPSDEIYLQTLNPARGWWELSINNIALLAHLDERLIVSGLTYQNSSIREDLKSRPENRNPAAYNKLSSKDTVFPWVLPFDLWLEETRAFLEALGIPRADLIDLARHQSRWTEEAAALELLGLSKSEADLILSATDSKESWIYWGLAQANNTVKDHTAGVDWKGDWLGVLAHVSMLLQQSGLTHREYLDLRQTIFVGQSKGTLLPPNECQTSKIILTGLNEKDFTDHLNRVHLFTRLWRASDWSMRELDLALAPFGGQITPIMLQDLALLKRLSGLLALPISALVGCVDRLGTNPWTDHKKEGTPIEPAIYDSVFQRPSLRSHTQFDDFSLDKLGSTPNLKISDCADFIAASLGVKPAQVTSWISGTPNLEIENAATLENLSRLFAAASLCRALEIAPDSLPDVVSLLDAGDAFRTFTVPKPPDEQARVRTRSILQFVERVSFVRQTGFDLETLSYLLQHKVLPGAAVDAGIQIEQKLTETLTNLRSALQTGVVLGDVSADNLQRQLARLGWYPALIEQAVGREALSYQPGASIEINSPPTAEPVIPLNLRAKFTYRKVDASHALLQCSGSLTDSDFDSIEILFPVEGPHLRNKYKTELAAQVTSLASFLQVIELKNLPESEEVITGVTRLPVIPGELASRLKFEMSSATDGKFRLAGWLTSTDMEALSKANPSSSMLSAAFRHLQAQALTEIPATSATNLEDAKLILREPDQAKRNRAILLRLVPHLELDSVTAQLSTALGLDQQAALRLINAANVNGRNAKQLFTDSDFLRSDPKSPAERKTWEAQFKALELLSKIATIAGSLAIRPDQWDWILGGAFSVLDVLALPISAPPVAVSFDGWRELVDLFRLRDVLPNGPARLSWINGAPKASTIDTTRKEFAGAFKLSVSEVDGASSTDLLTFKGVAPDHDYNKPSRLLELAQLLHVIKTLGTTASNITQLIKSAPDESAAQLARTLFAASIDLTSLPEQMRPVSNRLRNLQRNALIAYLINRDHLADSNELFDRYLIDVEMGSCMVTSRIKQAISSVQLFVQRCLLNLERPGTPAEPGVSPASIDARRWQWMKFYRVWEANRKVFLYPENWIEPELRDDKTEIFQAFESDLLQSEISHETALVAFRKYVDKMADIANLTVVSMVQDETDDGKTVVHLVGRDNSQPYKHYYRQWKLRKDADFGSWTAWEEIAAQVDSEHVLVFLFGGSIYLAWPTISAGREGPPKWKISMNLAKRTAAGWTKLKKGRDEIECPMVPSPKDERTSLVFALEYPTPEEISIETYGPRPQPPGEEPNETEREAVLDVYNLDDGQKRFGNIYVRNPYLNLNLRVLDSYTYEYAGKLRQPHYELSQHLTLTITVTFTVTWPKSWDVVGGYRTPVELTVSIPYSNTAAYQGLFGELIKPGNLLNQLLPSGTKTIQGEVLPTTNPPTRVGIYHNNDTPGAWLSETPTLVDVTKIKATVIGTGPYKTTPTVTKEFHISKGTAFTWQEDFIFELLDDPKRTYPNPLRWLPSADPHLVNAGGFHLRDDDSLELDTNNIGGDLQDLLSLGPNTEHFISGYREVNGPEHELYLGFKPHVLKTTPGQYFVALAHAESRLPSTREVWSYRDDLFSLLFWRNGSSSTNPLPFRVVPFSTGGMRKLISDVAKDRLLNAVARPQLVTPRLLDIGTGVDSTVLNSVTQVKIDFEKVPTGIYNWEVFFHNPLLVATQLSRAQRFEEAQRWFHLIFDPTTNEPAPTPTTPQNESARYWRFLPFREAGQGHSIEALLEHLAKGATGLSENIDEWAENPFRPHLVARHRLRSYQFAVVLKYLQNLIAWGDQIFRRDTIESINEATQLYVLAAKILGKRPVQSPKSATNSKSYRDINSKLDDFSNAWIPLEALVATQSSSMQSSNVQIEKSYVANSGRGTELLKSLGSLYFCVPGNEKLAEYWDTVEDRLFKIRHCMNLEGVERQLPIFEPPIDPALLVRAVAAGLDLAAVLSQLDAPRPPYRFNVMIQKALELCGEVRALGGALLSALEKKDAEQLSLLRSGHEIQMLKLVRTIKEQQKEEAETNLKALRKTREITVQRYLNYQRLMGKQNVEAPAEGAAATLLSSTLQLAPPNAGDSDTEGLALIAAEAGHMGWLNDANNFSLTAGVFNTLGGISHALPNNTVGSWVASATWGGSNLGNAFNAVGSLFSTLASNASFQANRSSVIGGHQRRFDEWQFQSNVAAKELEQIDKQIIASDIRKQIAEGEIVNHDQQIANAEKVDESMREKFTNQQLYSWMVGQISSVYFRTYQLAHDIAKRAERAYRFELGLKDSAFIDFGYWDSLKKGLLSGERLYHDLKRMEVAYLDQNKREYEITKHISLMQLDPLALLRLKKTGQCEVSLPEALFDLDFAGHYLRRIKSVSVTIPCVTGPYTTVPCTLTILKHSVRHSSNASGKYARDLENDDPRFTDNFGAIQSIVTSSAQNDSGMFETNLRDERYLQFEGAGAISSWRLELPNLFQPFDYDTISDVILHLRYTARDGGSLLKNGASTELQDSLNEFIRSAGENGLAQAFSVRHEFPTEWHRFLHPADSENKLTLNLDLKQERFPIQFRTMKIRIGQLELFLKLKEQKDPASTTGKTYAEEYAAAGTTPLTISVTPPGASGPFNSNKAIMGGIPHLELTVTSSVPVTFALGVTDADIQAIANNLHYTVTAEGATHQRLKAEAIEDLFIICHYSVT